MKEELLKEIEVAEKKAVDALSRYKFQMFGYWAAIWVHLNRISGLKKPNPFKELVIVAKEKKKSKSSFYELEKTHRNGC